MPLFPPQEENALYFSRSDPNQILGTFSKHDFELDGFLWPSVEHYFQAMKFENENYREKIRQAPHPLKARKLGRTRFRKIRRDWHQIREVVMTRAVYTKCRTHIVAHDALLDTGDQILVESSQYDYYWGCGRDRRGHNTYGKVLMNVRKKLREELLEKNH